MPRAKLKMELIASEKSRNTTFKKRKDGLFKKMHEFTTLCGVDACAIIYGPNNVSEPEIWPQNPDNVRKLIDGYKARNNDSNQVKTYGLSDFFQDRKRKAEEDLSRLRKKNRELKYPTSVKFLDTYGEDQLRQLCVVLKSKIDYVMSLIEILKKGQQDYVNLMPQNFVIPNHQQEQGMGYHPLNQYDPSMNMMVTTMKNSGNQNFINYAQHGGAFVNGITQLVDPVITYQNQVQNYHFAPQLVPISCVRQNGQTNISMPVLSQQFVHQMIPNMELPRQVTYKPATESSDHGGGGGGGFGLKDVVPYKR